MDSSKKRKSDENGAADLSPTANLTPDDVRKVIEPFTQDQLIDIVADAMCRDSGVLNAVRQIADRNPINRKLFIRGLGWETTTEKIRSIFSNYGELEEAAVILDKATGKSKGYGFITFRHVDGALLALKDPSKKIDGRVTVTQLAASGGTGATAAAPPVADVSQRKIFVGNVPATMPSDRLLALFASYGEIQEGPMGFDKLTGKFKGYAFFIYKTVEGAQAALAESLKVVDGSTLQCKLVVDGNKGRPTSGVAADGHGDVLGMGSQNSFNGPLSSQFAPSAGSLSSYGGFSDSSGLPGVAAGTGYHQHLNPAMQSSIGLGIASMPSVGSQAPSSFGGSGVGTFVGGGGPYGSSSQYAGSGGYGSLGTGSSLYNTPVGSASMPSSGYPDGGPYSSSSSLYQVQHQQVAGSSPRSRIPPGGGMYQSIPHYF